MSLILDALRKMEQERRSRRGAGQDLRPEVLRYRMAAQPKEPARLPLKVVGGAVLVCAGLAAGFLLKGHDPGSAVEPIPVAPAARVTAAAPPPAAPVATAPAQIPVPAAPAVPAAVADEPPPPASQPAALSAEQPRRMGRSAAPVQTRGMSEAVPLIGAREEAAAAPVAGQDIVISGIAYQDERRLRRAVLNGTLVGEGAEVADARVVEIKETKVKLSRGGQVFEVPFSSGLQSR